MKVCLLNKVSPSNENNIAGKVAQQTSIILFVTGALTRICPGVVFNIFYRTGMDTQLRLENLPLEMIYSTDQERGTAPPPYIPLFIIPDNIKSYNIAKSQI